MVQIILGGISGTNLNSPIGLIQLGSVFSRLVEISGYTKINNPDSEELNLDCSAFPEEDKA
jgi:hypothetical protein